MTIIQDHERKRLEALLRELLGPVKQKDERDVLRCPK